MECPSTARQKYQGRRKIVCRRGGCLAGVAGLLPSPSTRWNSLPGTHDSTWLVVAFAREDANPLDFVAIAILKTIRRLGEIYPGGEQPVPGWRLKLLSPLRLSLSKGGTEGDMDDLDDERIPSYPASASMRLSWRNRGDRSSKSPHSQNLGGAEFRGLDR